MNYRWLFLATAVSFVACNKSSDSAGPAASAASSAETKPSNTAPAPQPVASAQAQGELAEPSLPSAEEAENTSDITASSYKKDLDGLEKEIIGLK
jgi:hypothetical protein